MNSFKTEIKQLEGDYQNTYDIEKGQVPVILTSAHGIGQKKRGGKWKFAEPYTRGIARYVSKKANCFHLVKNEDTGVDPNKQNNDEFKIILLDIIKENQIKLAIDLHGAKKEHDFDVEIGTLDGKTASEETVNKLIEALHKNGIKNIAMNEPFNGGDITKTVFTEGEIECIQLEINQNYRNLRKVSNMRKVCKALIMFINNL